MSILKGQIETHEGDILFPKTSFDMIEGVPNLSAPNILINSDFKSGIINQRGKTTYNGHYQNSIYTVDMWRIMGGSADMTVTVGDKYIRLSSTNKTYAQAVGTDFGKLFGQYTLAIQIKNKTCNADVNVDDKQIQLKEGLNVININSVNGFTQLQLRTLSNGSFDVEFIKLEQGSIYTGMPVWDKLNEYEKCFSFFGTKQDFRLPCVETGTFGGEKYYAFSLPRTQVMHRIPSIKVGGTHPINNTNGIVLRPIHNVGTMVGMKRYEFEVHDWDIIIKCYVDNSVNVENTPVQLLVGYDFIIEIDANEY